jgi:hypothetical protein
MNLQDHLVLPYMLIGNWWTGWGIHTKDTNNDHRHVNDPINGVHGWVFLDSSGEIICDNNIIPV